jgi:hypothetical protein
LPERVHSARRAAAVRVARLLETFDCESDL